MINKSFFRKKVTKIYIIISSIILTIILLILSFSLYYKKEENNLYNRYSTFVIESDNDAYKILDKKKAFDNIKRVLTFYPSEGYDIIGDINNNGEINGNVITSGYNNGIISWMDLSTGSINNKIVVVDNKNIKDNEIKIGIPNAYMDKYTKEKINNIIGKNIGFINNNENIEFIFKDIYYSKFPELSISKELYDKLLKQENKYTYRADIISYRDNKNIKEEFLKNKDLKNQSVVLERFYYGNSYNTVSRMENITKMIDIASSLLIIFFIIFIVIINNNQIKDLNNNIYLEKRIGYSKINIKFNIFMRLMLSYLLSFIFSMLFTLIIIVVINNIFDINLTYPLFKSIGLIFLVITIITFIPSFIINKVDERR